MTSLPAAAFCPDQPPLAIQLSASVADQLSKTSPLYSTCAGATERLTEGIDVGVDVGVDVGIGSSGVLVSELWQACKTTLARKTMTNFENGSADIDCCIDFHMPGTGPANPDEND
ncbi:MAG: hypothetical protein HKM98_02300 [Gammaproteobacteria bacterium]|nr:hypothetical protein [Gammaproteobacteria bacterium]